MKISLNDILRETSKGIRRLFLYWNAGDEFTRFVPWSGDKAREIYK